MAVGTPVLRDDVRMTRRILHVVTNVSHYADPDEPTGLWLSELTHAYDIFEAAGYEQRVVSPKGGRSPLEPRALKRPLLDASAQAWLDNPARMALLAQTARPNEIDANQFDVIYFTGGHAVMWDFPGDAVCRAWRAAYGSAAASFRPFATAIVASSTSRSAMAVCW
jgi:hypothetical protein